MAKIIKKQIKRSIPLFLIFNLAFASVVFGLVFNLDLKISQSLDKIGLSLVLPNAEASDTASTTVTVRNAPPDWAAGGDAYESPVSTSSSPVNVGGTIGFRGTADDRENNSFYLAVCGTNSITASTTGGAPSCAGGQTLCISGLTPDNTEASCTYTNVADPGAETKQWYAFACDNHTRQAECSVVNRGSNPGVADGSSPFYVNHRPVFNSLFTYDNNKNPGGTFGVRASSTDSDVMGGLDILHLYVCSTNQFSTSTGCLGVQWCHGTSTNATGRINCSFATTSPAMHGTNWGYYGFVMDQHYFTAVANPRSATYTVNDVRPAVTNINTQSGDNIQLNLRGAPEVEASTTSSSITDANGCADILSATGTIYYSNVANGNNCTADDDNCYQIAAAGCSRVSASCTGPTDSSVTYICTTTLAFHAIPTDNSTNNPNVLQYWLSAIAAIDGGGSGVGIATSGVDVMTSTGLQVTETLIAYGNLRANENTGTNSATTTVVNYGNSPLDSNMTGTDMLNGSYYIRENNQEYSTTYQFLYTAGTDLSSTTPAAAGLVINKPTTAQTNRYDYLYWGIGIPALTMSGDYSGMNTFTGILDTDNW